MGKLTDIQIRVWIKNGEHFEGRSDGDGLYLSFPENYSSPMWRFRYRFAGKQRIMNMGSFASLPLSKARETARELSAKVALGHDVAGEKQERKRNALANPDISQERSAEQPEGALLLVFKTVLTGFRRCQSVALEKCSSDA
mgnify:CR=1 FL=1